MNQSIQKKINVVDKQAMLSFKTTTDLHNSIKNLKDKKPSSNASAHNFHTNHKASDYIKEAKIEKLNAGKMETKFTIESEVVSLPTRLVVESLPRTQELLRKQRESRRERHIKAMNEYEKLQEFLSNKISEDYNIIKTDIIDFFKASDKEIEEYFETLTDSELLTREIDFIDDLNSVISSHRKRRDDKISNLQQRLENVEKDKEKNFRSLLDNLVKQMMDISFILEPEIKAMKAEFDDKFAQDLQMSQEKNKEYLQEVNKRQHETFEMFENQSREKEKRWRKLKHEEAIIIFRTEIQYPEFTNPLERIQLYDKLNKQHVTTFNLRKTLLEKLDEAEILAYTKSFVERWIEEGRKLSEKANEIFDKIFEELMKEHTACNQKAEEKLNKLRKRLNQLNAELELPLEEVIEKECSSVVKRQYDFNTKLLKEAIKFVEDSDLKIGEILNNVGNFSVKFASKLDEYKKEYTVSRHHYEIEKAKAADENDEKLEGLQKELEELKKDLSRAVHHPMLGEILKKNFDKIDLIEVEYRRFHDENQAIAKKHPGDIENLFYSFEKKFVENFEMFEDSKRAELQERNLQRAKAIVKKMMEDEDQERLIAEQKAIEDAKNKKGGAKPPAQKAKDPKKMQQEQEEREKALLAKVGVEPVQVYASPTNNKWVVAYSLEEISKRMYQVNEELLSKEKAEPTNKDNVAVGTGQAVGTIADPSISQPTGSKHEEEAVKPVDYKAPSPLDFDGNKVLSEEVMFELPYMTGFFGKMLEKIFSFVSTKKVETIEDAKSSDRDFIENSILLLDERLKALYPQKGKIEVDIFEIRGDEITKHKKRYERHTRTSLDRKNLQTEGFNYLLETCLQSAKDYEAEQKILRESLKDAQSLPKMQGILNNAKENYFKFSEKCREAVESLNNIAKNEIETLLAQNREFIKNSKLFEQGGNYSDAEVQWYDGMLKEIDEQFLQEKARREDKKNEIEQYLNQKRKETFEALEKQYAVSVEELAARDGTGKKYGRPRRLAQERVRTEMTKCEKAQEMLNDKTQELKKLCDEYKGAEKKPETFIDQKETFSMRLRKILMTIRTCIGRYALHIDALKLDGKYTEMPRVNYNESRPQARLDVADQDADKLRKEQELEQIGPLFYQKDNKKLTEWVLEIEKSVKEESQKIYIGGNQKFLTGTDKIPDYLRAYLENMKFQMEEFRISCVRQLRNTCIELSGLAEKMSDVTFGSIKLFFNQNLMKLTSTKSQEFEKVIEENENSKRTHKHQLRPNLSNPACRAELDELCAREKQRLDSMINKLKVHKEGMSDIYFQYSSEFLKATLNSFDFLIAYFDNFYLFEDFIKLPGDEEIQKKHENLRTLLKRKQKGFIVDTSSERSIEKSWEGLSTDCFNIQNRVLDLQQEVFTRDDPAQQGGPGMKGKAPAGIKPAAVGAGAQKLDPTQPVKEEKKNCSKEIKSYKTYRQKSAFGFRNSNFKDFKDFFDKGVAELVEKDRVLTEDELKYEFAWEKNLGSILGGN